MRKVLILDPRDNIAVCLVDLNVGDAHAHGRVAVVGVGAIVALARELQAVLLHARDGARGDRDDGRRRRGRGGLGGHD